MERENCSRNAIPSILQLLLLFNYLMLFRKRKSTNYSVQSEDRIIIIKALDKLRKVGNVLLKK